MYQNNEKFKPFEKKVWLSNPTMYPDSMGYVMEAYKTNWMSTVGVNINEVERLACEIENYSQGRLCHGLCKYTKIKTNRYEIRGYKK